MRMDDEMGEVQMKMDEVRMRMDEVRWMKMETKGLWWRRFEGGEPKDSVPSGTESPSDEFASIWQAMAVQEGSYQYSRDRVGGK